MKTKFIKVDISEKLPEKDGVYFSWINNPNAELHEVPDDYNKICRTFKDGQFNSFYNVTHCLIEVPDREHEMIEMLSKLLIMFTELDSESQKRWSDEEINTVQSISELLNPITR